MNTLRLEIFRPGKHVAMSGREISFSEADLAAIAAGYDPARHEAPVVLGHPQTDDPAYGWVKGLAVEDGALVADLADLEPAFAEALKARRYAQRSPAFYAPDAAGNPSPGSWGLRHLGFLGAQPPGCKGLKPVAFADGAGAECFAEGSGDTAYALDSIAQMFRALRDWLIESQGQEKADALLTGWAIKGLEDAARRIRELQDERPAFAEQVSAAKAEAETARATLAARETQIAAREARIAAAEAAAREADDTAFIEGLVREGKLAPGRRPETLAMLRAADDVEMIAFGEGEPAQTRKAQLRAFLAAQPAVIAFGEVAPGGAVPGQTTPAEIAAAAGQLIAAAATKGQFLSAADAVAKIVKEKA